MNHNVDPNKMLPCWVCLEPTVLFGMCEQCCRTLRKLREREDRENESRYGKASKDFRVDEKKSAE